MAMVRPLAGPVERFMVGEHVRIYRLLEEATPGNAPDLDLYARFRGELLRHLAMEDRVLIPFLRGHGWVGSRAIRVDHAYIERLLVRLPTPEVVASLKALLDKHDPLEEGPDGMFAACDELAGAAAGALVDALLEQPPGSIARFVDGPTAPVR